MQDYKKLKVWKLAHLLTLDIYNESKTFPKEELFSLTNQVRRSAYSIPMNLSEGCGRFSKADKANFFQIAFASSQELEYTILLLKDLGYINEEKFNDLNSKIIEIKQMLNSLIFKIREQKTLNSKL